MMHLALSLSLVIGLGSALAAQDWVENRFDRVYLRNGNFLDGKLVKNEPAAVVLAVPVGRMTIRRTEIDRIEAITIRSLKEKPKEVPTPKPVEPPKDPFTPPEGVRKPGDAPPPKATPGVAGGIYNPDPTVKAKVAEILDRIRRSPDTAKSDVARLLKDVGGDVGPYLAGLLGSLDPAVEGYVAGMVIEMKDPEATPVLLQLIEEGNAAQKTTAIRALGAIGDTKNARTIRPFLGDRDPVLVMAALDALTAMADRGSFRTIGGLALSRDRSLRSRALNALGSIARKHGMKNDHRELLVSHLDRARGDALTDVALALSNFKDKSLWRNFLPLLESSDPKARAAAVLAFNRLKATDARQALLDKMPGEEESWVRIQMCRTAAELRILLAVTPLISWLDSGDSQVVSEAAKALKTITKQDFGTEVAKWNAWWTQFRPAEQE